METPELHDFADLGDFCPHLTAGRLGGEVADAAQGVQDALTGAGGLVTASGHQGVGVQRATGAAVYLPVVGDVQVVYDRLDFGDTQWSQFLRAYGEA